MNAKYDWRLLNDPDFWARHFTEEEDVLAVEPPVPHSSYARQMPRRVVRCFWLDEKREWMVEMFRQSTHIRGHTIWVYRIYELDVIERFAIPPTKLESVLYWRWRGNWLRDVPWVLEAAKQALMMEALR